MLAAATGRRVPRALATSCNVVAAGHLHRSLLDVSDAPDVQTLNVRLDGVVVLRVPVQVHGYVEVEQRLPVPLELHVHLAQLEVHTGFLRCQAPHLLQVYQCLLIPFQVHEHARFVEVCHAVLWLALRCPVEVLQCQLGDVERIEDHAEVAAQHGVALVDLQGPQEVVARVLVLLLAMVDVPQPPPGVVVPRVQRQCLLIHRDGLVELLVGDKLVAAEGVGICEGGVHLDCPPEELDRRVVLFLETEAVPHHAPDLRLQAVPLETLLRQVAELDVLPQVPQRRRVQLQALHSPRLRLTHLLEVLLRLLVLRCLEVAQAHEVKNKAGVIVPAGQRAHDLDSLAAVETMHAVHSAPQLVEQGRQGHGLSIAARRAGRHASGALAGRGLPPSAHSLLLFTRPAGAAMAPSRGVRLISSPVLTWTVMWWLPLVAWWRILRPPAGAAGGRRERYTRRSERPANPTMTVDSLWLPGTGQRADREIGQAVRDLFVAEGGRREARRGGAGWRGRAQDEP
mmetsp:Transcript_63428/g.163214  ORF Transcript_63428/g.163214 Transcript_63428/m.163214 type:complete len:511 (-) Transcript_63428:579-2111(-)